MAPFRVRDMSRIAVLGAGLCGLVAARDLRMRGHEVVVLEATVNRAFTTSMEVQIDVWSTSPRTNEQIKSRLDELLEIPRVVATGISTTNYNVTNCTRVSIVRVISGKYSATVLRSSGE